MLRLAISRLTPWTDPDGVAHDPFGYFNALSADARRTMLVEPERALIPWEIAIVSDEGPITDSAKWLASSARPSIQYHALNTSETAGRSDLARRLLYSLLRMLGANHCECVVWVKDVFMGRDGKNEGRRILEREVAT